ncbi:MAG: nitrilase [Desulfurococcales archaeon]|nr:nitrilase [Desulfurococcales archaeon]
MLQEPVIVSVLQTRASSNVSDNMRRLNLLVKKTAGDILVMPEYAMIDPTNLSAEVLYKASYEWSEKWLGNLKKLAQEYDSCIIGTLFEPSSEKPRVYNTAVVIDRSGEIVASYSKTHLFDILGFRESDKIARGEKLFEPVDVCGARIGLAICFEIRYPELFRLQAEKGVDVFFVPSAWYTGHGKEEAYRVLAQARAHENVSYVVGAVLYGEYFTGRSLIVDPRGVVVAEAGFGERVVEAVLEPEILAEARRLMPLLDLRRKDLYRLEKL